MINWKPALIMLVLVCFLFESGMHANGQLQGLSLSVYAPGTVYVGESFVCQATIRNEGNENHSYVLQWSVYILNDVFASSLLLSFNSSGVINAYETVVLSETFVFTTTDEHFLDLILIEDGARVVEPAPELITVIKTDWLVGYTIKPDPVYPSSSFSLNLTVTNSGDDTINYTKVRVFGVAGMQDKISLQSGAVINLGEIFHGASRSAELNFTVSFDTQPAVYPLRIRVEFYDARDRFHEQDYYAPVRVSSREVLDQFDILRLQTQNTIDQLRNEIKLLGQTLTTVTIALVAVIIALALVNYVYARRLSHIRRRAVLDK